MKETGYHSTVLVGANSADFYHGYFCPNLNTVSAHCKRTGTQTELMHYIFTYLGWQYRFVQSPDGYWASKIDGEWVGFMKMLSNESLDITLSVMVPFEERIRAVKFQTAITSYSYPGLAINKSLLMSETVFRWWMVFSPFVWFVFLTTWILRSVIFREEHTKKWAAFALNLEMFHMLFEPIFSDLMLPRLVYRKKLPFRSLLQALPMIENWKVTWISYGTYGRIKAITAAPGLVQIDTRLINALTLNPPKIIKSSETDIFSIIDNDSQYFTADDGYHFYEKVSKDKDYQNIIAIRDVDTLPLPVISLMGNHLPRLFRNNVDAALIYSQDCGITASLDSKYYHTADTEFTSSIVTEVVLRLQHMKEVFGLLLVCVAISLVAFLAEKTVLTWTWFSA